MNEISRKQQILQDLKKFVLSKATIIYIVSDEEDRMEGLLKELSSTFQPRPKLFTWNPFQGLVGEDEGIENSKNPLEALDKVIQRTDQAFFLFEGLHSPMNKDPLMSRKLKDVHRALRNRYSTLFIIAPVLVVPEDLRRDMVIYELPMPDATEVERILNTVINGSPHAAKLTESLTPQLKEQMVKA